MVPRAESSASFARLSFLAVSRSKIIRWTLNIPWFGKCDFLSAALKVTVEFMHSGSEHKSTVVVSLRQSESMQTILDPPGVESQLSHSIKLKSEECSEWWTLTNCPFGLE